MEKVQDLQKALKIIHNAKQEISELGLYYEYDLNKLILKLNEHIKVLTCSHTNTKVENSYDSHYSYENTICCDCGKTITSIKI